MTHIRDFEVKQNTSSPDMTWDSMLNSILGDEVLCFTSNSPDMTIMSRIVVWDVAPLFILPKCGGPNIESE